MMNFKCEYCGCTADLVDDVEEHQEFFCEHGPMKKMPGESKYKYNKRQKAVTRSACGLNFHEFFKVVEFDLSNVEAWSDRDQEWRITAYSYFVPGHCLSYFKDHLFIDTEDLKNYRIKGRMKKINEADVSAKKGR